MTDNNNHQEGEAHSTEHKEPHDTNWKDKAARGEAFYYNGKHYTTKFTQTTITTTKSNTLTQQTPNFTPKHTYVTYYDQIVLITTN